MEEVWRRFEPQSSKGGVRSTATRSQFSLSGGRLSKIVKNSNPSQQTHGLFWTRKVRQRSIVWSGVRLEANIDKKIKQCQDIMERKRKTQANIVTTNYNYNCNANQKNVIICQLRPVRVKVNSTSPNLRPISISAKTTSATGRSRIGRSRVSSFGHANFGQAWPKPNLAKPSIFWSN